MMRKICLLLAMLGVFHFGNAQQLTNKFQPFTYEWPTPDESRLASGAPGPKYWQQQADYKISVTLDAENNRLAGSETVVYHNNSPHTLTYLWVQLDQNKRKAHSACNLMQPASNFDLFTDFDEVEEEPPFDGGMNIQSLTDAKGNDLKYTVVETNMRIELPQPLAPGQTFTFSTEWDYEINDATLEGRSGYEMFSSDGNAIYEIAQFYPRMCVYDNVKGWQNKPFFGPAEFALEFGDFEVAVTAPADHIVSATGELLNGKEVLSETQLERLEAVRQEKGSVKYIVTPEEAADNSEGRASRKVKTWKFSAQNVRDFAIASSRKFAWEASLVDVGKNEVLVQSFYPNEAVPLWNKYATHSAIHALKVYSRMTVDYPYPVCNVINGPVWGMEYPMMAFCGGRPNLGGGYSRYVKYAMISVVMHEVGHNFFPMVINSDERRWAWMDEGLNSFCQFIAEQEFEPNYPSRRGFPEKIAGYMRSSDQNPIMTNPESILQNGRTSYEKTAVGLNILRETVMGREVFDMAFKEYANRWKFKHPEPSDFFRTMEDASGVDLDWYWRAWFYSTDPVDIGISLFEDEFESESGPSAFLEISGPNLTQIRNLEEIRQFYVDERPELQDGYSSKTGIHAGDPVDTLLAAFIGAVATGESGHSDEKQVFTTKITLENIGGVPMPVTLKIFYANGQSEILRYPAQIWMKNNTTFLAKITSDQQVIAVSADPQKELPDIDRENNFILIRR